jgi:tetratricopeptide (TPR) repeat protein
MEQIEKTVFISYRRTNTFMARAVYQELSSHGFDCFLDMEKLDSGDFEQVIEGNIKSSAHFIIILTPSALDRCNEVGDWLRREIETAIESKRNIVPLLFESFDFNDPNIKKDLTGKLELLTKYNALRVPPDYFDDAMKRLRDRFLNRRLSAVIHPRSTYAQQVSDQNKQKAKSAGSVTIGMIGAEIMVEKAKHLIDTQSYDFAIEICSNAIKAKPEYYLAYAMRGLAHYYKQLYEEALEDYNTAIELEPEFVESYTNRGNVFYALKDYQRALDDFAKAISLDSNAINAYINRAATYYKLQMYSKAKLDLVKALKIDPNDSLALQNLAQVEIKLND